MPNTFLQNVFMVAADSNGDVQCINIGKNDDGTPIYFELETQDLEFGDRTHLKQISDKIVVFCKYADASTLEVKANDGNYKQVKIDLEDRVNIGQDINTEGFFFNFKWYGEVDSQTPIFEGVYLEKVVDKGITYG